MRKRQRGHIYYRCHTPKCQTTTVREEVLEQAIICKLAYLEIEPKMVGAFSSLLEARLSQLPKRKTQTISGISQAKLDTQMSNLVDALLNETIDEETYKSKEKELHLVRAGLVQDAESEGKLATSREHLRKFLEHSKSLAATYVSAFSHEKRQLVELAFSNNLISGREPMFKPRDWIVEAVNVVNDPYGGLYDAKGRSGSDMPEPEFTDQLEALACSELRQVVDICDVIVVRKMPKPTNAHCYRKAA